MLLHNKNIDCSKFQCFSVKMLNPLIALSWGWQAHWIDAKILQFMVTLQFEMFSTLLSSSSYLHVYVCWSSFNLHLLQFNGLNGKTIDKYVSNLRKTCIFTDIKNWYICNRSDPYGEYICNRLQPIIFIIVLFDIYWLFRFLKIISRFVEIKLNERSWNNLFSKDFLQVVIYFWSW